MMVPPSTAWWHHRTKMRAVRPSKVVQLKIYERVDYTYLVWKVRCSNRQNQGKDISVLMLTRAWVTTHKNIWLRFRQPFMYLTIIIKAVFLYKWASKMVAKTEKNLWRQRNKNIAKQNQTSCMVDIFQIQDSKLNLSQFSDTNIFIW